MLLLKAEEHNWGLVGPGSWEKTKWKVEDTGWYQYSKSYRSGDDGIAEIPRLTVEGQLPSGQMEILRDLLNQNWTPEKAAETSHDTAWEFKMYENDTVIKHRLLDYIDGVEPFEAMAALLQETEAE